MTGDVPAALAMRDVTFRHRGTGFSLEVPSFSLAEGERVLLRGPSGSGKTTLLGLATGLLAADAGRIEVAGRAIPDRAAARDRLRAETIGVIHQQFNLLPYLDTLTNVLLPSAFGGPRARPDAAGDLLSRLGLPERLHRVPARRLSVGQQQRAAIARALLRAPRLIVADEPTSALDGQARDRFLDLLLESVDDAGAALLLVSHDDALIGRFERVEAIHDLARVEQAA